MMITITIIIVFDHSHFYSNVMRKRSRHSCISHNS